jgi:putative endonuclease
VSLTRRSQTGRIGERAAARHLEQSGYRVIERNYRTREGEIDLIAASGTTLVFCEVKTLVVRAPATGARLHPLESVRHAKRTKIRRLARTWLSERSATGRARRPRNARFDAVAVLLSPSGRLLRLEHVEAAF